MGKHGGATVTLPSEREITITRVFDAPRTLVFTALGEATLLTMTIACASAADRDALLAMRVDVGTTRSLDNLDEFLGALQQGS